MILNQHRCKKWDTPNKPAEFFNKGEFGLASGQQPSGGYQRIWFGETVPTEEIEFQKDVFLLAQDRAKALKAPPRPEPAPEPTPQSEPVFQPEPTSSQDVPPEPEPTPMERKATLRMTGDIPAEL